jgi:malonyl-CoA O-methyltransferase
MISAKLLEAYDRWAQAYPAQPHNPLMEAEQRAMLDGMPLVTGRDVLDLACGTGRYARLAERSGAAHVVALDFSLAMLGRAAAKGRVRGDISRLPLRDRSFHLVISGLALGHAPDLVACMREIARVLRPGGVLIYSDFHPEAGRCGLERSFKDAAGERVVLPRTTHDVPAHMAALESAGLRLTWYRDLRVGYEVCDPFPGSEDFYRTWQGTPIVLVAQASRPRP